MDVLDIAPVAGVADGAEPFLQHQLGEAEDRIERRAHLVADLGEEIEPPRDHGGVARAIMVIPLGLGFGFRRLLWRRVDAGWIDQADQFKSVAERPHLEADLEPPSAPRQRFDRNDPLVAGIRRGAQQGGTPGHHRVQTAGAAELVIGAVAEGIGEGGIGMDEIAIGENADRGRHRFEQSFDAGAAER